MRKRGLVRTDGEPVAWEVSSGRWHWPRDKWLAGRTQYIQACGFTIADGTENYAREVWIRAAADAARVAGEYRGQQPLTAKLGPTTRSTMRISISGSDSRRTFAPPRKKSPRSAANQLRSLWTPNQS